MISSKQEDEKRELSMIDVSIVGRNIAFLRRRQRMTQQGLAEAMNVSHQAVSKWENGAALPDIQTVLSMSRLFGITMEALLTSPMVESV